ncbi:MAG: hypothetical protein JWN99_3040 [Ilumatobacteraceae bacterium]|nr:hypothetical protein [Ilumatobacteraceae bacterium]
MARTHRIALAVAAIVVGTSACGGASDEAASADPETTTVLAATVALPTTLPAATVPVTAPVTVPVTEPATTIPATTAPAPTTTVNPFADAAQAYLALRDADRAAFDAATLPYGTGAMPWEVTPSFCAGAVVFDSAYRDGLAAYAWPVEVSDLAAQLEAALTLRVAVYDLCAHSPGTWDGQRPAWDDVGPSNMAVADAQQALHRGMNLPLTTL